MSYMALYRKWRPRTFEEVVEQESVVTILKNAVTQNRVAHAYLFSGTRGTGKTTLAKIFARAVNCLHPVDGNPCNECEICRGILNGTILDVSEIDAASNNGVDNIRAIIEDSVYASSVARYRVYIIDEVHMLSSGAFNALLKTLEEPPENVIFILATTEPQKLLPTILSRCQRFEFKRISREGIAGRLRLICKETGIEATDEALAFLADKADGALRDAISLLDQTSASTSGKITLAAAREATGSLDRVFLWDFTAALVNSDARRLLELSHTIFSDGRDPSAFVKELMTVLRNMMVVMTVTDPSGLIYEDAEGIAQLKRLAKGRRPGEISLLIQELARLDNNLKWAVSRQIVFEAGVLSISDRKWSPDAASFETRLSEVENRVADLLEHGVRVTAAEPEAVTTAPAAQTTPAPGPAAEPETVATAPAADPEPAQAGVARRLSKTEWDRFLNEMETRGQMSMLTWYTDSTAQYELPGDRLLLAFTDDMTVSIFRKSTAANLKVASDCLGKVFGRPMEQIFAMEKEAAETIDAANKEAVKNGELPARTAAAPEAKLPETSLPAAGPAPQAAPADREFRNGAEYFQKLSEKMNFPIEWN
ncbi:MAG: DNA polymerase III subunit gamma/tau [Clostridia bacterium]|nr:DNA polymerase III subunit gamma/tau [Clostridia bacterium]